MPVQVGRRQLRRATTHRRQVEEDGHGFPLLSDFWPHGQVAERYGVFDKRFGVARRATFLVDRDGTVRYTTINDIAEPRDLPGLKSAIASLG